MRFTDAGLPGAFLVDVSPREDERGFFARTHCEEEFAAHGIVARYPQSNISWNRRRGTLRGMHYNAAPHAEAKLVRCTRGAIHDVILDLRSDSPAWGCSAAVELSDRERRALYVPPGLAHGFLTLRDDTEVLYMMGALYVPEAARGIRWDDPSFSLRWPFEPEVVSERDRGYPAFDPSRFDG